MTMKETKGIYTFSTKTFDDGFIKDRYRERTKNNGDKVIMDDYEVLTLILSALYWKKNIGPTKLYTDNQGLEFLSKCMDMKMWDEVDTEVLEEYNENIHINHRQFFAAPKVYALSKEKVPFCSVDIDLLYRGKGNKLCKGDITTLHLEKVTSSSYPNPKKFSESENSNILSKYKWRKKSAINCGLIYFGNQELVDRYTNEALTFIKDNPTPFNAEDTKLSIMTLAEQRLLGEIAHDMKLKVKSLVKTPFDNEKPIKFIEETAHTLGIVPESRFEGQGVGLNGEVIHLWGYKSFLSSDIKIWDSILGGMKSEENENRLFLIFNLKKSLMIEFGDQYSDIMNRLENSDDIIKCSTFSRSIGLGPKDNVYFTGEPPTIDGKGTTNQVFGL